MSKLKATLEPAHKRALYAAVAFVWLSGALWLVDRYFRQTQTDFGAQAPPTQAVWLELHGAAAMIALVLLGSLAPDHIRLGWKRKAPRPSGVAAIAAFALLAASGWCLYYLGDQGLRRDASVFHWALGLALPAAIALHVRLAR